MSKVYNYKNSVQALGSLLRDAGPAGLLKGYWMTNLSWIPWNVIYISAYEVSLQFTPHSPPLVHTLHLCHSLTCVTFLTAGIASEDGEGVTGGEHRGASLLGSRIMRMCFSCSWCDHHTTLRHRENTSTGAPPPLNPHTHTSPSLLTTA
jgi:hypothetical protein